MKMTRLKDSRADPPPWLFCLALLVRVVYNLTVARHYFPLHDSLAYQNHCISSAG